MALDLERDARRVRWASFAASLAFAAAVGVAGAREILRPRAGTVIELPSCVPPDRCASCHAEVLEAPATAPLAHRQHDLARVGCACCHGGTPRALVAEAAHASPGAADRDPRLVSPGVEASCGRCHPPGVSGAPRLERGANLYVSLGCALCHGGRAGGTALAGPALARPRSATPAEIRSVLLDPEPGSSMPSYRALLAAAPGAETDLVLFVLSLALPPGRVEGMALQQAPCGACHAGAAGAAAGRYLHRCPLLVRGPLACAGCHTGPLPESGGECPRVLAERPRCGVCHAPPR